MAKVRRRERSRNDSGRSEEGAQAYEPGPDGPWAEKSAWRPDGGTLYFKAHDAQERTTFWAVSGAGGRPRMMLRLDDPNRQSIRPFFTTDGKRFYFPIEERESDIYMATLVDR